MSQGPTTLISLTTVFGLGIGAQWFAWAIRKPSILLLLICGLLAGPVFGVLDPDALLGDLLFPVVSLSVALILFEGGLSLRIADFREVGVAITYLLTFGVGVSWVLTAILAYFLLGMPIFPSVLLGALLVVTGPTVIGPLLQHIRPTGRVGPIARWEGIVIDPVGAVLAVLVFEAYHPTLNGGYEEGTSAALSGLLQTIVYGGGIGLIAAWVLAYLLKRHLVPDHLQSSLTLMVVVVAFTLADLVQSESGLVSVTLMGFWLANSSINLKHITEFKENLTVLLVSTLFILLSARVDLGSVIDLGWRGPMFVAAMILLVRPASVFVSMAPTSLTWREKAFLAWLAPRGIVAAAVSSVFAIELGPAGAGLVPATFMLIVGTVVVYGLTAFPLARALGLASANPQGVLLAGANPLAQQIGQAIQEAGYPVLLADTNRSNIRTARMKGLRTANVSVLAESAIDALDLGGLGRFLGLTQNDEVNVLGAMHFAEVFGRANVYKLPSPPQREQDATPKHLTSRNLFADSATYDTLRARLDTGSVVKLTKLTDEFDYDAFQEQYGGTAIPLFLSQNNKLTIVATDETARPGPGQTLIALVHPTSNNGEDAESTNPSTGEA